MVQGPDDEDGREDSMNRTCDLDPTQGDDQPGGHVVLSEFLRQAGHTQGCEGDDQYQMLQTLSSVEPHKLLRLLCPVRLGFCRWSVHCVSLQLDPAQRFLAMRHRSSRI